MKIHYLFQKVVKIMLDTSVVDDLTIRMTNSCNLCCPYCFASSNTEPTDQQLSVDEIKAAIEKINPVRIGISGGEPLLRHDDVMDLLKYCYDRNDLRRRVRVETNGTLPFDFDTLASYADDKYAIQFATSLDGFEEFNDSRRGEGSFQKTSEFAKQAVEHGFFTIIKATVEDDIFVDNLDYYYDFIKYCRNELGVHRCRIGTVKDAGRATEYISNVKQQNGNLDLMIHAFGQCRNLQHKFYEETGYKFDNGEALVDFVDVATCITCGRTRESNARNALHLGTDGLVYMGCAFVNVPICHWTKFTPEVNRKARFLFDRMEIGAKDGIVKRVDRLW